jgi:hypothetical protein
MSKEAKAKIIAIIVSIPWILWSGFWVWGWIAMDEPMLAIVSAGALLMGTGVIFGSTTAGVALGRAIRKAGATESEPPQPVVKSEPPQPVVKSEPPQPVVKSEAPQPEPAVKIKRAPPGTFRGEMSRAPWYVKVVLGIVAFITVVAIAVPSPPAKHPVSKHHRHHHGLTARERYAKRICRRHSPNLVPIVANLDADDLRQVKKYGHKPPAPPKSEARAVLRLADVLDEVSRLANKEINMPDAPEVPDAVIATSPEAAQRALDRAEEKKANADQAFFDNDAALVAATSRAEGLARQLRLTCLTMPE